MKQIIRIKELKRLYIRPQATVITPQTTSLLGATSIEVKYTNESVDTNYDALSRSNRVFDEENE